MAKILGFLGTSHSPGIARAYDQGDSRGEEWKEFFSKYEDVRKWIEKKEIDTVVFIYNDHLNNFELDNYPSIALGVTPELEVIDEGFGKRNFPKVPSDFAFAKYMAEFLVNNEFDISLCNEMKIDHGIMSILPMMDEKRWSLSVIPIAINVIQEPLPLPVRVWNLGKAIAKAVENYPDNQNVMVVAAGGLSHHLQGEKFGETNEPWDLEFMRLIEMQPHKLVETSHKQYIERGGVEAVEMMLWLGMRGALEQQGGHFSKFVESYSVPGITACGLIGFESN